MHRLGIYDAPGAFDIRDICDIYVIQADAARCSCSYFSGGRNRRFAIRREATRRDATRFPDTLLLQFVVSARRERRAIAILGAIRDHGR